MSTETSRGRPENKVRDYCVVCNTPIEHVPSVERNFCTRQCAAFSKTSEFAERLLRQKLEGEYDFFKDQKVGERAADLVFSKKDRISDFNLSAVELAFSKSLSDALLNVLFHATYNYLPVICAPDSKVNEEVRRFCDEYKIKLYVVKNGRLEE